MAQKTYVTSKPSKQRKKHFQAPDHVRVKLFSATLSPELRKEYGVRSLPVRSGDTIRVMRGDFKGFEGKVSRVDRKKFRVYIEGLTREKVDGSTVFVPVHPSNLMITKLNLNDKWRRKILERKKKTEGSAEKAAEKRKPKRRAEVKAETAESEAQEKKASTRRGKRKSSEEA